MQTWCFLRSAPSYPFQNYPPPLPSNAPFIAMSFKIPKLHRLLQWGFSTCPHSNPINWKATPCWLSATICYSIHIISSTFRPVYIYTSGAKNQCLQLDFLLITSPAVTESQTAYLSTHRPIRDLKVIPYKQQFKRKSGRGEW